MKFIKTIKSFLYTVYAKFTLNNWSADIQANGFTKLSKATKVGGNIHFNGFKIYGKGECIIGDNFHSGFGCIVLNSFHNYNGESIPYDNTEIHKPVVIEDNVWIGVNVTLLGGCYIEEGTIIQAGSVVVGRIAKGSIAGGHPAKAFSNRDMKKYEFLKSKRQFN